MVACQGTAWDTWTSSSTASFLRGPVRRSRCARDQATLSRLSSDAAARSRGSQLFAAGDLSALLCTSVSSAYTAPSSRPAQSPAAEGTLPACKSTQIISHHGMCCRGRRTRDHERHMIGPAKYQQRDRLAGHGERHARLPITQIFVIIRQRFASPYVAWEPDARICVIQRAQPLLDEYVTLFFVPLLRIGRGFLNHPGWWVQCPTVRKGLGLGD